MSMIDKVREALQITSTASDTELQDLIDASIIDLKLNNVFNRRNSVLFYKKLFEI